MMSFALPKLLGLLLLMPVLVWGYVVLVRRRSRRSAELAAQGFVPTAATMRLRNRRHIPYIFFLAGLTLLLFAVARPQARVSIPKREGTVILAFDVSNSMRANDLKPTRMEAAKAAAKAFVDKQPSSIKVGVVAFSDGAVITQQPTNDKQLVLAAIKRLSPQGATSLGQGIFASLNAIAGKPLKIDPATLAGGGEKADGSNDPAGSPDIGYYGSAAIVLLSDGENTVKPDPVELAKLSSVAGVKIYPIGIGSTAGTVVDIGGFKVATALDEKLLGEIATNSDGAYYHAEDEASLAKVYGSIDLKWHSVAQDREITGIVTGVSTLLLVIGAGLSLLWFGRVV